MLSSTFDAIKAMLRADPSVTAPDRTAIFAAVRGHPTKSSAPAARAKVLSPKAAGEILNRGPRGMHLLAQQGILRKVYLPGRKRSAGFRQADVEALIN
jgi:hypothetical protein